MTSHSTPDERHNSSEPVPIGTLSNMGKYLKFDALSGFLVFLIALPLCLGISLACGYPPIAGIFTAIIGSILTTFISNSELTIKGPAAGLIVIAIGCVNDFGGNGLLDGNWTSQDQHAYQIALGVGVAAAAIQIVFGLSRGGILGEFFPTAAVHGMLAAIGVIIIAKQLPVAVGGSPKGEPLELLRKIPETLINMNPAIGLIGISSLLIMFGWPLIKNKQLKKIPAAMVVLIIAVPLGLWLGLNKPEHTYQFQGHEYTMSPKSLVQVPANMFSAVTMPDFSGLKEPRAWKWIMMFAIIGTLESLLSAKAIDLIDPWKRKTNLDRDNTAVGAGNLCAALVGGLPMISEIVRSRANIDNGARTRFADMFHGLFLLGFVALVPWLINLIPLAALAAMLVYTGFRLAHPREFVHAYHVGMEQLLVFVVTIVGVLATDLLIGICIGVAAHLLMNVIHGLPLQSVFLPYVDIEEQDEQTYRIMASHSAVFSNWILFRRKIVEAGLVHHKNVIVDLSETKLVDHTVMGKLHEMARDFDREGLTFTVVGLENHRPQSDHPQAARRRRRTEKATAV